jgi:predicted transcriptional regulator
MATQNNLYVPDDLLAALQEMASAEGKTVEQVAEEALRKSLEEHSWQDLIAYGHERGRSMGFTEEQAADVVHEWRKGQRR